MFVQVCLHPVYLCTHSLVSLGRREEHLSSSSHQTVWGLDLWGQTTSGPHDHHDNQQTEHSLWLHISFSIIWKEATQRGGEVPTFSIFWCCNLLVLSLSSYFGAEPSHSFTIFTSYRQTCTSCKDKTDGVTFFAWCIFVLHVRNAHFPVLRCDPAAQEVLCSCTTVPTLAAALNGRMSCLKFPREALWQGSLTTGRIPSATKQGGRFGFSSNTVDMAIAKLSYCLATNPSLKELVWIDFSWIIFLTPAHFIPLLHSLLHRSDDKL